MYINDYEVYVGGSKIGKIVMNDKVLYEANSSGDIIIDVTDYSVEVGSTISVIYELEGNVTEDRVSVIYDDTMFTKTGNDFTVIGEGYSEIVYCIDDKPNQTIRVATAYSDDIILDFSQSSEMPKFPSNVTYKLKSGTYGFSLTQYEGGGYGLVSGNKAVETSVASGYLKLDASDIEGTFTVRVTYSYQTESISYDYGRLYLTTTSTVPEYSSDTNSFLKVGGSTAVNNAVVTSPEKTAGIYYLHFLYRKDYSGNTGYDAFCIHKIEILGLGIEYPITYIGFDSETILCKTGDSFSPVILPYNANEEITYTYDSEYIEEKDNLLVCKKSGITNITLDSKYVNKSINVNIEPAYISEIVLESSLIEGDTVYEGDSFTITPSTFPLYHDDELICEYDNYYLNKVDNTFEILETAMGQTLTITYRGLNVYEEYTFSVSDKPGFYIEYTIKVRNTSDTVNSKYTYGSTNYYYYLPRIYNADTSKWSVTGYDKIEITKKDGTITDDVTTLASDVEKIKIWYPKDTTYNIRFQGYSSSYPCYVNSILNDDTTNISNLTSFEYMFYYCTSLTSLDLSDWDISNVTNTSYMFYYCTSLTSLNLSTWDTSNITTYSSMLLSVPTRVDWHYNETNYTKWTLTESQTGYSGIFPWNQAYIEYTIEPVNTTDYVSATSYSTDYYYYLPRMYTSSSSYSKPSASNVLITKKNGTTTTSLSTKASDVEKIKVFYDKNKLYKFAFYGYSTSYPCKIKEVLKVKDCIKTNLSYMFYYCTSLMSLNLSSWDTSEVTNMTYMFYYCTSLMSLNLSSWDTNKVTKCSYMFSSVPTTVDWHYDGTNYIDWTLTEAGTDYSLAFPWNAMQSITLDTYSVDLTDGEMTINAVVYPEDTIDRLQWSCDSELIHLYPSDDTFSCELIPAAVVPYDISCNVTVSSVANPELSVCVTVVCPTRISPYYVEYTVDNTSTYALNKYETSSYYYCLPRVYSTSTTYTYTYDRVEITLLDGTITTDMSITCDQISKVRLWYPVHSYSVKFYGSSSYKPVIKELNYIKSDNFENLDYMFYYCYSLSLLDLSECILNPTSKVNSFLYSNSVSTILMPKEFNENFVIGTSTNITNLKDVIFSEGQDISSFFNVFSNIKTINPTTRFSINVTNGINSMYVTNLFENTNSTDLTPEISSYVRYFDDNDFFSVICESNSALASRYPGIGDSSKKINYTLYIKIIFKKDLSDIDITSGTIYTQATSANYSGSASIVLSYDDSGEYIIMDQVSTTKEATSISLPLNFTDIIGILKDTSRNEIILKFDFKAPSSWAGGQTNYGSAVLYLSENIVIEY